MELGLPTPLSHSPSLECALTAPLHIHIEIMFGSAYKSTCEFSINNSTNMTATLSKLCCAVLCCAVLCYAMLCYAMLCYAMLCYAMLCYAMLCYAMLCYAMLCYAMLCYAMLCCALLSCSVILYYARLDKALISVNLASFLLKSHSDAQQMLAGSFRCDLIFYEFGHSLFASLGLT
jgi:hypothetical protein